MPKNIIEEHLNTDFIDVDELMYGRNYVRELYSTAQAFDMVQYRFWRDYLITLAMSAFKWVNVPAGIDTRAIEYILIYFGQGAMFKEYGGHMFAQVAPFEMLNMYYNPNGVRLIAPNGKSWQRHCEAWSEEVEGLDGKKQLMAFSADAAICFDNMLRMPFLRYINNYAKRLATIDRIIDVNMGAQRTPFIVSYSEEQKGTADKLLKKLIQNEQAIKVNSTGGGLADMVNVLATEAPYVADKLMIDKQKLLNEAVTFVGVDNTNNEKRERMIDAEATANNEQIMVMRRSRLECRRTFAKRANTVFGLTGDKAIQVKWGVPHLKEQADADMLDEMDGLFYEDGDE